MVGNLSDAQFGKALKLRQEMIVDVTQAWVQRWLDENSAPMTFRWADAEALVGAIHAVRYPSEQDAEALVEAVDGA